MKKILFDIKHPAQLNLFNGLAKSLQSEGWQVTVCYLNRGKLPAIIRREYKGFDLMPVGSSRGTKWSIFWDGNIKRTGVFIDLLKKERYNIGVAASSAPLALACRLTGTPIIQFYDDLERKRINKINAILSDKLFFPPIIEDKGKIGIFNCLKEWSYLSPDRFIPNPGCLDKYHLKPHEYIFVREVSNKSFNYYGQNDAIISRFAKDLSTQIPVLLSLEDKSIQSRFPSHWIQLQEPVEDIHSLIYYSKLVVSSGDSMAREGAMLGVPSIYCGIREMKANELLIKKGTLFHLPEDRAVQQINTTIAVPFDAGHQHNFRKKLMEEWDDMQDFMKTKINQYKRSS